jgi:hypothetical protein
MFERELSGIRIERRRHAKWNCRQMLSVAQGELV